MNVDTEAYESLKQMNILTHHPFASSQRGVGLLEGWLPARPSELRSRGLHAAVPVDGSGSPVDTSRWGWQRSSPWWRVRAVHVLHMLCITLCSCLSIKIKASTSLEGKNSIGRIAVALARKATSCVFRPADLHTTTTRMRWCAPREPDPRK